MSELSKKFKKKWEKTPRGLRGAIRPAKPLKPRINYALNSVELQIQRIGDCIDRYTERDKRIFNKLTAAYERHDNTRAKMLANEIAEIRKQREILMHSRLSLDNVALRLRTVFEFGNFVSAVAPVVDILKSTRTGISEMVPEVGNQLQHVEVALGDMMFEMGQAAGAPFDFEPKSIDAQKILNEAAMIAESRTRKKLPGSPNNVFLQGHPVNKSRTDNEDRY